MPWQLPISSVLREEFETAVLEYHRSLDGKRFNGMEVIGPFMTAHPGEVSRATCIRWVRGMVHQGVIARTARATKAQTRGRQLAHRSVDTVPLSENDVPLAPTAHLPAAVRAAMQRGDRFAIVANLRECIFSAHTVMNFTRGMHDVDNAKLLIVASEHLRKCMDTVLKLQEQVYTLEQIDRFFQQIVDLVRLESPATAARILERLEALAGAWMQVEVSAPQMP